MKVFLGRVWYYLKRILLFLLVSHLVYLVLLKWVNPPVTLTQLGSFFSGNGLRHDYVSWDELSPHAKLAVISAEDQRFPDHNGFDWKSIQKAMDHNEKKPRRIKGASTISQQVAKNVFLWQGRSWVRKGLEVYFTFMIELIWGKKRILEVYLNVAETGKGIFGFEAASKIYFRKPAAKLTRSEAAMLAASLPNPRLYTVKPLSSFVASKYPWILGQMNNLQSDPDMKPFLETGTGKAVEEKPKRKSRK